MQTSVGQCLQSRQSRRSRQSVSSVSLGDVQRSEAVAADAEARGKGNAE